MRKFIKRTLTVLLMLQLVILMIPLAEVSAATTALPCSVDNLDNYLIKTNYMVKTSKGYMRVVYDGSKVQVEYYDSSFKITSKKSISLELPVWGGFFKGSDGYYLIEGKLNTKDVDGTEVVRIIKYDFSWKRIGAGKIAAKEGWDYEIRFPFYSGCVSVEEIGNYVYVATGRQGYVDDQYGMGHQGMMLIKMNRKTFGAEVVFGDFWHSFSQYMTHRGNNLYLFEQSEGSRGTKLSRYDAGTASTDTDSFIALQYGGTHTSAWSIPCYASVDDVTNSASNVLGIGTSIDQSKYDSYSENYNTMPYNIYLTVTPLSQFSKDKTKVVWLTKYKNSRKSFKGVAITKVNDNRFLVTWEEDDVADRPSDKTDLLSTHTLHYLFIDGAGNKISKEFRKKAAFSDCHPVISGGKAVFCASSGSCTDFYSIDTANGAFSKKVYRILGDNVTWELSDDGVLTITGTGAITNSDFSALGKHIKKIIIAGTISSICDSAFTGLDNLRVVVIEDGVRKIGKTAFAFNDNLKQVYIPDSVTSISEDILWTGYYWIGDGAHVTAGTIYAPKGSAAYKYARKNNIAYKSAGNVVVLRKGASAKNVSKAISNMKNDKDLEGSEFGKLKLRSKRQSKTSITLSWSKVSGAKQYVIYGSKCGKSSKMKKLAATTGKTKKITKAGGKRIQKGKYYKFMVVAFDKHNKVISVSKIAHVATKGGKVGNHKSVKVSNSVISRAKKMKKGQTLKLGARQIRASSKLKVRNHRALSYESSNKKIATVSSKGVVKAVKKGSCYIYAYDQSGACRKIKLTVK